MNIIAADVGGTKTRLIIADAKEPQNVLFEARYVSGKFDSFEPLLKTFLKECGTSTSQVETLVLALPGLVSSDTARLTNLPWVIEKQAVKDTFGIQNVTFMNDFQASAFGTSQLHEDDTIILNPGLLNTGIVNAGSQTNDQSDNNTTRVAVGAGTGLGVAWADCDSHEDSGGQVNSTCAHDTEGGHIDFAPVDETQIQLLQFLQKRHDHVSYERILSGEGLVSLYEFCSGKDAQEGSQAENITAEWVNNHSASNAQADQALSLFVQIYGAYIGNIAMIFKPYGGIYITGGIAAKIIDKMQSEDFINAYLNKGRMRTLVEQIAVYLVTNERIGVLGAMSEAAKVLITSEQQTSSHQVSLKQVSK